MDRSNRLTLDPVPWQHRTGLVRYPVPLTPGRFAFLLLPAELSREDVARLTAYVQLLAGVDSDPPGSEAPC